MFKAAVVASATQLAGTAAEQPAVPPAATVVLLTGLAGDVESERTFGDQLRAWIELLERQPAPPQRVVIFRDGELALPSSTRFPIEPRAATRAEFVALGEKLAGHTGPLLVVAFGHGGMQGTTPVFHVRGSRLTPAGFLDFAGRFPHVPSHWLLFFRGSGAFASALADANRSIIASERDMAFASDPVGMALVLKLLRSNPASSFIALADALGRATTDWYADRHLARTEEPTLWLSGQAPRLLAPAEPAATLASRESSGSASPNSQPPPPPPAGKTPVPDSPAWKNLARVEAKAFPDADGVVLRRRVSYTLGDSPALAAEHEEFIQVLTAGGKRLGDFDFAFAPPHENLTFLDCEVLRPDGTLARLDPDDIREAAESVPGDYRVGRRKVFSLPGVGPGAVLHLHYRSEWKTFPLPRVSLTIPVASELPINDLTVQVTVGGKLPFHFALDGVAAQDPQIQQGAYGTGYSWHFERVPADLREPLGSPHAAPALAISTWADWAEFAGWYARISKLADQPSPELVAKARELARDATTDREKVRAVYNYVTGLRYVAIPFGVNSHRPHAAANVFKNQFGDCKDKANLFNTLLRSLGFDACLVLVPRFSQAHEAVPGFAFNHAISRVALGSETLWVDTTDDVCRFGLLPPGDPARNVLVVDGKSAALTPLPHPAASAHRLRLRTVVTVSSGDALPATIEVVTEGFADYQLRAAAGGLGRRKSGLPLLGVAFRTANGAFALDTQTFTRPTALDEAFAWRASGELVGVASPAAGTNTRLLRAPFWLPREWDASLHRRRTPLYLNQGYPLALDESVAFALPADARLTELPTGSENTQPPLRWKLEWLRGAGAQLTATLRIELRDGELSAPQTTAMQPQLRALFAALARGATLTTGQ